LAYERAIAHSFDHSLVCTAIERRDFESLIPGVPVSTVGNCDVSPILDDCP
jgi:hypothetical protein